VTATSSDAANGSPVIIVGSQTLAADQVITTGGVVLSLGTSGLFRLNTDSEYTVDGAIPTNGPRTFTAIESVNGQGFTVVDVGDGGEIATVDGEPVTLPDGEVLSAASGSLVIAGTGGITWLPYSSFTAASTPRSLVTISLPSTEASSTKLAATTSKSDSALIDTTASVLLASFLAVLGGIMLS